MEQEPGDGVWTVDRSRRAQDYPTRRSMRSNPGRFQPADAFLAGFFGVSVDGFDLAESAAGFFFFFPSLE